MDTIEYLREERNKRLADCDWVVIKARENGQQVSSAWKTYRQALRDITNTYDNLNDVVWPEKPSG